MQNLNFQINYISRLSQIEICVNSLLEFIDSFQLSVGYVLYFELKPDEIGAG